MPDENGLFKIQTDIDCEHIGYLMYEKKIPVGFMVFCPGEVNDVAEFYIIPAKRLGGFGQRLARYVFASYPGQWQVRQISGADSARAFWRSVIFGLTDGNYQEEEVEDHYWGRVYRQSFEMVATENID